MWRALQIFSDILQKSPGIQSRETLHERDSTIKRESNKDYNEGPNANIGFSLSEVDETDLEKLLL